MALKVLITTIDTNKTAKSFGIVGSILLNESDIKKTSAPVAANNNAVPDKKPELNSKKLVAVIDQLYIMDGFFKQKLNNQKLAYKNSQLNEREDKIERGGRLKQRKDAEKVKSGSGIGLGLLGLAGLGLLAYDPIVSAIKSITDFAVEAGTFISDTVKEITGFFEGFLLDSVEEPPVVVRPAPVKPTAPLREQAEAAIVKPATPPPASAKPVTPPAKPGSLREQAEAAIYKPVVKDARPVGKPAPKLQAKPAPPTNTNRDTTKNQPEDLSKYIDFRSGSGSKERFNLLNPEIKKALITAAKEYYQTYNEKLGLESAVRTKEDQQRLWDMSVKQGHPGKIRWPSGRILPVARAGSSSHQKGNAVDVVQWSKAKSILNKYGLFQTVKGDAPHYTLGAGRSDATPAADQQRQSTVDKVTTTATKVVNNTLTTMAKFIGTVGGNIVGPGVARDLTTAAPDFAKLISNEAASQTAQIAKIKNNVNNPAPRPAISPQNIGATGSSSVQNVPTMVDRDSVQYYLNRFGYKETNSPIKAAA